MILFADRNFLSCLNKVWNNLLVWGGVNCTTILYLQTEMNVIVNVIVHTTLPYVELFLFAKQLTGSAAIAKSWKNRQY